MYRRLLFLYLYVSDMTYDLLLGPRVFMNCPLDSSANEMEVWFINLWNHFIIPYLMGTIMAGIEVYINVVTDKVGVTFTFSVYIDLLS